MNLIEQLKQTPKWSEFEDWWDIHYLGYCKVINPSYDSFLYIDNWCDFPFEFQEGVFKKFIESQNKWNYILVHINDNRWQLGLSYLGNNQDMVYNLYYYDRNNLESDFEIDVTFESFEELILWYFNN
jgi:hypothetical protein